MTLIFLSPAAADHGELGLHLSRSSGSTASGRNGDGAAALHAHFVSSNLLNSAASRTVRPKLFDQLLLDWPLYVSCNLNFDDRDFDLADDRLCRLRAVFLGSVRTEHSSESTSRRHQNTGDLRRRSLQEADDLAAQSIEEGSEANVWTPATSRTFPPSAPPTMVSFSLSLAKAETTFAAATGSWSRRWQSVP